MRRVQPAENSQSLSSTAIQGSYSRPFSRSQSSISRSRRFGSTPPAVTDLSGVMSITRAPIASEKSERRRSMPSSVLQAELTTISTAGNSCNTSSNAGRHDSSPNAYQGGEAHRRCRENKHTPMIQVARTAGKRLLCQPTPRNRRRGATAFDSAIAPFCACFVAASLQNFWMQSPIRLPTSLNGS